MMTVATTGRGCCAEERCAGIIMRGGDRAEVTPSALLVDTSELL